MPEAARHERRRVERRRGLRLARLRLVARDLGVLGAGTARQRLLHGLGASKRPWRARRRAARRRARGRLDLPVRDRYERPALQLTVDDEPQRRGLDAPHGQVVRAVPVRGQRHEAREDGSPDEIDVLTGVRRLREVEIDRGGLGERRLDLFRRQGRVAHPDVAVDDRAGSIALTCGSPSLAASGGAAGAALGAAALAAFLPSSSPACRRGGA